MEHPEFDISKENCISELEKSIKNGDVVICLQKSNPQVMQIAMNYLLKSDFVCVQNDVVANKWGVYHTATFVKSDYVQKFLIKH